MGRDDTKYAQENDKKMGELGFTRVWGKQFRYIYPINKSSKKYLKNSTMEWTRDYPKDKDLQWKVKKARRDRIHSNTNHTFYRWKCYTTQL